MARTGWRWEDQTDGTVQVMPINPNDGAAPTYAKSLTKERSVAPGALGQVLIYEGADQPREFSFSGVILEKVHYDFILNIWNKRHLVKLTDDLGNEYIVYLETFTPKRVRSASRPWRHTYDASAVIVG
jgi:hypothetical protein